MFFRFVTYGNWIFIRKNQNRKKLICVNNAHSVGNNGILCFPPKLGNISRGYRLSIFQKKADTIARARRIFAKSARHSIVPTASRPSSHYPFYMCHWIDSTVFPKIAKCPMETRKIYMSLYILYNSRQAGKKASKKRFYAL